jgi:hypothetical protein
MNSPGSNVSFRDVILLALAGFIAIVILILPYVNVSKTKALEDAPPPGNVIVHVEWPQQHTDVDLWVQAPGDVPVGYSNLNGMIFNLLRDDLGRMVDLTDMNYEDAISRGVMPGEYTVNLHLYRNAARIVPVPVAVRVSVFKGKGKAADIFAEKVDLLFEGQEMTVIRFSLTAAGDLVAGSFSRVFRPLRAGAK